MSTEKTHHRPAKRQRRSGGGVVLKSRKNVDCSKGEITPTRVLTADEANSVKAFAINQTWCETNLEEFMVILKHQGWISLFFDYSKTSIFPDAMNEFRANFKCVDGVCSSCVNGTSFEFNAAYIAKLLNVRNEGFDLYVKGATAQIKIGVMTNEQLVKAIGGDLKVCSLTNQSLFPTPLQKLLFNLVRRGIVPRTQKRTLANLYDASLMYCLEHKIPINFPALMIKHLSHCVPSDDKVGYASLLTMVFRSFSVDLRDYGELTVISQQIVQSDLLRSMNLAVANGRLCWAVATVNETKSKGEKEVVPKVVPKKVEKAPKVVPKVPKDVPRGKRRSIRVATRVPKVIVPPVFVDISCDNEDDDENIEVLEDTVEFEKEEKELAMIEKISTPVPTPKMDSPVPQPRYIPVPPTPTVPSSFTGFGGFAAFGSSSSLGSHDPNKEELKEQVIKLRKDMDRMILLQESANAKILQLQDQVTALLSGVQPMDSSPSHT
ncbi:uncharacterized protein [Spinacia oleracea]|uniref:Uncharacterized protein n=1 Tax=Spinacia oleracea TaxID=3562 RepID=A0ABM3RLT5_SPIOL|nr:uncharacterized protein LOC130470449 [Spinacia oleracea]XP_056696584.1 uncharacterized protein LOC130470449 [Spinacia oleracea]XP_056696585.1 uncharacterized protein LOC130470449 [Spinacia oleracea]XP_056696586.1 uncharacterized protein LOC130470449 [Spinacia oleracea]